ncbi:hypothetical protein AAF712_013055 [Marasmius tenuissimus]|uniref:Uncharacterized protein n=1 Tax=Marasmius tenuissimus TaxID=585030 RepID=A0ABR2ZF33_9AGAR
MKEETTSNIALLQLPGYKRKRSENVDNDPRSTKRTYRESSLKAELETKEKFLGPGGYFDSQTTDSQYFDFPDSQRTGVVLMYEEESQPHYSNKDDDWYYNRSHEPDPPGESFTEEDEIRVDPNRHIKSEPDTNPLSPPTKPTTATAKAVDRALLTAVNQNGP